MTTIVEFPNEIMLEIMRYLDFKNCCKPSSLFNFILTNKKYETLFVYWNTLSLLRLSNNYVMKIGNKMHPNGQIKFCHLCRNFNDDEIRSVCNLINDIKNKGKFKYYIDNDNKEKFLDKIRKCSDEFDIKLETRYLVNLDNEPISNSINNRSVYIRLPYRY